ncbi:MAG TPA: redoxin domain-containing protein [Cellulomonas sp.]
MTSGSATKRAKGRSKRTDTLHQVQTEQQAVHRRHRLIVAGIWTAAVLVVAGLVTAALMSSRPTQDTASRVAPDFTLTDSDGASHTLSALRGHPVLLYFSEGAGCDACIVQQAKIEAEPGFAAAGITELPIVMNTAAQINADRQRLGAKDAFLLDDGTVSQQYGVLGTGMHANLPGHGFVLVDAAGNQVWKGDYPSMWIDPKDLLGIVESHLTR